MDLKIYSDVEQELWLHIYKEQITKAKSIFNTEASAKALVVQASNFADDAIYAFRARAKMVSIPVVNGSNDNDFQKRFANG